MARWYRLAPEPVLEDSLVSPLLEDDYDRHTSIGHGQDYLYLEGSGRVILRKHLMEVEYNEAKRQDDMAYIWDFSTGRDTVCGLSLGYMPSSRTMYAYEDGDELRVLTGGHVNSLSVISLGDIPESEPLPLLDGWKTIIGLALPAYESWADVNSDGAADVQDLLAMLAVLRTGGDYDAAYDLNADCRLDILDLVKMLQRMARK